MRYIDVDKIIAQIKAEHCDKCKHNEQCAYCDIDKVLLPFEEAVDADVVVEMVGHWIKYPHNSGIYCSLCKKKRRYKDIHDNYCPNCGAKMDEGRKEK